MKIFLQNYCSVKIFNKKDLLIKTNESYLLIDDYEFDFSCTEIKEGMQLESVSFNDQLDVIIKRHESKYPKLPISKMIVGLKQ